MADNDNNEEEDSLEKTSVVQSDTFKVRIAQAEEAPPCLVLLVGPANQVGRQWPIDKNDYILGRAVGANVQIDDKSMSKSHAKLMLSAGEVNIIDLESTNRTVVNSKILTPLQPHRLENNDQIKTGNVIFKFLEKGNIETVSVAQTFGRGQTDALTGINNRGALNAQAVELFNKSRILDAPLSIMVLDIDFFKKINDTYGHPGGDFVLKELTRHIRETQIRGNDFFARYGGEEFCILFLGSPFKTVQEIAERIRKTVQEHVFDYNDTKIPITVSVGLSTIAKEDHTWNEIFERSDKALYEAKNGGRNKVCVQLRD